MNIISLAISTFITNYIIMFIIRVLPLRNKRLWQTIIISLFCLGEMAGYVMIMLGMYEVEFLFILELIGSIFGVLIGYIASMMIILDGIRLFKSKRLKEFERNLNNKEGTSIPRWVSATIAGILGLVLLIYGIVLVIHYDKRLLITIIGLFLGVVAFLGGAIYLFISGAPKHKTIRAENLLFVVDIDGKKQLYQSKLSKDFTIDQALGKLNEIYLLDEYGLIITPKNSYVVKGIKLEYSARDLLQSIQMDPYEGNLDEALSKFQKYNRKKIILDENNTIIKIIEIK